MTSVKRIHFVLMLAVLSSEVTSWIVDMAEVGKLLGQDQYHIQPDYEEVNFSGVASEEDNEVVYTSNYAENFQYRNYRKNEVDSVIQNGGIFLEGLSDALASYRALLENCKSSSMKTGDHKPEDNLKTCQTAEEKKHVVQKLSQLALTTTNKLKDQTLDNINLVEGDAEADLIQLARSLDRLSTLTGHGSARGINGTRSSDGIQDNTSTLTTEAAVVSTEDIEQQSLELLEQVENGRPLSHLPPKPLTAVKSVQKRDIGDVMKYYVKYKVWNGSNPINDHPSVDHQFEVQNTYSVLPIQKRSLADKKAAEMLAVVQKMRHLKCKTKESEKSKKPVSKLVKSIKVYRRKLFKNTRQ